METDKYIPHFKKEWIELFTRPGLREKIIAPGTVECFIDEICRKEELYTAFIYLMVSVEYDITLRQAINRFEVERKIHPNVEKEPNVFYHEETLSARERRKPIRLSEDNWLSCKGSVLRSLGKIKECLKKVTP